MALKRLYLVNMRHLIGNIYKDVVKLSNKESLIMLVQMLTRLIIFTKRIVVVIMLLEVAQRKHVVILFTKEAIPDFLLKGQFLVVLASIV